MKGLVETLRDRGLVEAETSDEISSFVEKTSLSNSTVALTLRPIAFI